MIDLLRMITLITPVTTIPPPQGITEQTPLVVRVQSYQSRGNHRSVHFESKRTLSTRRHHHHHPLHLMHNYHSHPLHVLLRHPALHQFIDLALNQAILEHYQMIHSHLHHHQKSLLQMVLQDQTPSAYYVANPILQELNLSLGVPLAQQRYPMTP